MSCNYSKKEKPGQRSTSTVRSKDKTTAVQNRNFYSEMLKGLELPKRGQEISSCDALQLESRLKITYNCLKGRTKRDRKGTILFPIVENSLLKRSAG